MPVINDQSIAECYQPLFDLLYNDYGLTLTNSSLVEIILTSRQVERNLDELEKKAEKKIAELDLEIIRLTNNT